MLQHISKSYFFKVECSTIYFISPTVRSYATATVTSDGNAVESFVLHDTAITTVNATAAVFFAVVADIVQRSCCKSTEVVWCCLSKNRNRNNKNT